MTHSNRPQRLAPPAPPGTLLPRLFSLARLMRAKEFNEREAVYLARLRLLPCLGGCGMDPANEAAHVRLNSGALGKHNAMLRKPADRWAVPLCSDCHRDGPAAQHGMGERLFWELKGINPLLVCVRLYAAKADPDKMRAVVRDVLAGGKVSTG